MKDVLPELVAFLAIAARATVLMSTAPLLSMPSIPQRVRLAMALSVSFIVLVSYEGPRPEVKGLNDLVGIMISESLIGIAIGLVARVTFEALSSAAQLVGLSMGLGYGGMIDPFHGDQSTSLAQVLTIIAAMMAIEMNVHGELVAWLVDSYRRWPPGTAASPEVFGMACIEQILASFQLSIRLAIPVAAVGVVGTVLLGVCGRIVPKLGLQNVGFAVSLLGGLWALAEAGPSMASITVNALSEVIHG